MLTFYHGDGSVLPSVDLAAAELPRDVVWIDVLDARSDETAVIERLTRLRLPSFADLSEIEASSRLCTENGALFLSAPLLYRDGAGRPEPTPVGFVLTADRLVTVRFKPLPSFETFARSMSNPDEQPRTAATVFVSLLDAIVDRIADVLEAIASDLDSLSHLLFLAGPASGQVYRPAREQADLRRSLQAVGRSGDRSSQIRDTLLGIARIVPFALSHAADWLDAQTKADLETLRQDLASLSDYDAHLLNKVQLLLDTTLGLINIEQNNIIKVLTIVSVVGVPPTLVASIYGMNFKAMPELDWAWGYPYALMLIVLSAILPMLWFRWRGWF